MGDNQHFYVLWVPNGGGPPTMRHDTHAAAKVEAERLAARLSTRVYVLKAVRFVEVAPPTPPVKWTELSQPTVSLPF